MTSIYPKQSFVKGAWKAWKGLMEEGWVAEKNQFITQNHKKRKTPGMSNLPLKSFSNQNQLHSFYNVDINIKIHEHNYQGKFLQT